MKYLIYLSYIVFLAIISTGPGYPQEINETTLDAYNLRMNGKADSARIIIENYLEEDSTDAMVNYEYARTLFHITPLLRDSLNQTVYSKQDSINLSLAHKYVDRAIQSFPGNYRFYWAKIWIPKIREFKISWDSLTEEAVLIYRENIGYLEKALELSPGNERLINSLSGYYFRLQNQGTVVDSLRLAELNTLNRRYFFGDDIYSEFRKFRITFGEEMQTENKIILCEQKLKKDSSNSNLTYILSRLYLENEEHGKALNIWKEAMKYNPELYREYLRTATGLYRFSWFTYRELRPEYMQLAKDVISAYIDEEPIVPYKIYALKQLALVYELNEENEQAEIIRKEAQKLDPYIYAREGEWEDLYISPEEVTVTEIN